jgi:hypothetical protein
MRRLLAALLLLCLSWQTLASAGGGVLVQPDDERSHAVLHFLGEAHHHHDGSAQLHEDDSTDSVQHLLSDACLQAPALLSDAIAVVLPAVPGAPAPASGREPPRPPLAGLERPPRLIS